MQTRVTIHGIMITEDQPTTPPGGGGAHPGHDLPLFPFHPIVVPPGGVWPGGPGGGGGSVDPG